MNRIAITLTAIFLSAFLASCASQSQITQGERDVKKPINCATAEGDIRALQSEKTTAAQQLATGITTIVPVGLVVDTVSGKTGTNAKVAVGDYNKMLDNKIAEIQNKCGL